MFFSSIGGNKCYWILQVCNKFAYFIILLSLWYLNIVAWSLGQTTEFRYVIRVAEGVNNGFYGLQSYYDPVIWFIAYTHTAVNLQILFANSTSLYLKQSYLILFILFHIPILLGLGNVRLWTCLCFCWQSW